jgi:hypothetical protein
MSITIQEAKLQAQKVLARLQRFAMARNQPEINSEDCAKILPDLIYKIACGWAPEEAFQYYKYMEDVCGDTIEEDVALAHMATVFNKVKERIGDDVSFNLRVSNEIRRAETEGNIPPN